MTNPEDALSNHVAFERAETGHELTTMPFETRVETSDGNGESTYRVVVRAPTLDAVVEGETVAEVVEEGWLDTLALRLEDPTQVTSGQGDVDVEVTKEAREVRVEMTFSSSSPERAAENAKALAEFVEGTWMQGLIPGYEYDEPAASLMERATQNYDEGGA